jgi:hypothetical protein
LITQFQNKKRIAVRQRISSDAMDRLDRAAFGSRAIAKIDAFGPVLPRLPIDSRGAEAGPIRLKIKDLAFDCCLARSDWERFVSAVRLHRRLYYIDRFSGGASWPGIRAGRTAIARRLNLREGDRSSRLDVRTDRVDLPA